MPKNATAYSVEFRPATDLKPYRANARVHSPEQVQQIKASIREFGWTNPVLADADGIVAGHGRVQAALELYAEGAAITLPGGREVPTGMVPVIDCTGWSEQQRRAYILADNKLAENATWDESLLKLELAWLDDEGFDLDALAFSPKELQELLAGQNGRGGSLSDLLGDGDESGSTTERQKNGTVNLTFNLLPAERDQVVDHLAAVRDKQKLKTTAEALVYLAKGKVK